MKEINVDFIEKTEEGLVKKNFTTKMKLVEGLENSLAGLREDIADAGKVDSVNGQTGEVILESDSINHTPTRTVYSEINDLNGMTRELSEDIKEKAEKKHTHEIGDVVGLEKKVDQINSLEVSEYSSVATNKDEDIYTRVEWKDRKGNLYATSTIIEDRLNITYHSLNKKISWKLFFDEDGFIYKKELI